MATCWLLEGMDRQSTLLSVDNDEAVVAVARKHLGGDPRATFSVGDGEAVLLELLSERRTFDLVFADAWPGKYSQLDATLDLVGPGGFYVVDDMLPQPTWPAGHQEKATKLVGTLSQRSDFHIASLEWSTGLVVATREGPSQPRASEHQEP